MQRFQYAVVGLAVCFLQVAPAAASVHLMVIQEVFPGPPGDESTTPLSADQRAQYVMLRMTSPSQVFTNGSFFRVEDADGNLLGSFGRFTANVSNSGIISCSYPGCPAILMGTQAADNLFTFAFDKVADGQAGRVALPLDAGRVCFLSGSSVFDCVAWGNFDCTRSGNCSLANGPRTGDFNGNGCDMDFGAPAAPAGLQHGLALTRTMFNCVAKENSTNFSLVYPRPVSNSNMNNNVDADGDSLIDVLDCEDANNTYRWRVADRQNLRVALGPPTTLTFSQAAASGTGVNYDLIRGTLAKIAGFTDAACLLDGDFAGTFEEADEPLVGDGFYYLARANATAACGGTTSYGPGTSPALDLVCP